MRLENKLKNLKWQNVAVEDYPFTATDNFDGFLGLEECTDYGFDIETKPSKKKNANVKKKLPENSIKSLDNCSKKIELNNGFTVETCVNVSPSLSEEIELGDSKKTNRSEKKMKSKQKMKLGEKDISESRRDILGAAETGSGKTLAFGIPILAGIMKLKEKHSAGVDIHELPYKKSSVKKKNIQIPVEKVEEPKISKKRKNTTEEISDEDGYSSSSSIGCVKVIDDIEMPLHTVHKTEKPLYALVMTPTRELAIQISRHLIAAAKYTGIKIATLVGGMAHVKQERILSRGPEIVVATPGRLWELIQQGQKHLQQLENIKFLAIDETDRMVERNHFEELNPLLEKLNSDETRKSSRQNFVFSATLTLVHDLPTHLKVKKVTKRGKILNKKIEKMTPQQKIKKLVDMIGMTDPKVVDITLENSGTAESLTECRITCALDQKDHYLYYVLKWHPGRTIVFCNSIGSVKRLAQLFSLLKCRPLPLHASMPQRQRLKNLERFRDDPHGVLIATDVAARGLDIPDVDHVIHYQVPRTAEMKQRVVWPDTGCRIFGELRGRISGYRISGYRIFGPLSRYMTRSVLFEYSGRTARASKEGLTILMLEPGEAYLYMKLCRTLNKKSELPMFPVPDHVLSSMREVVSLAREVDKLQLQHRRTAQEQGWLDKAAQDMDLLVDEDFLPRKTKDDAVGKKLQLKKKQLDTLLAKPIFPRGFSFKYPTLNDPDALLPKTEENALQVMKKALQSGELKKQKRKSKNAPLLSLERQIKRKKST
ncbi:ATP-dependent RNA helicase DDX24 [Eumeta japonica]|uniref:ATP-dependent RNA helicase n=1 Tax=Eumeta variegata TaxID=151549 RepID=A0A4C1XYM6_EUMVA|nr:ATP-dependent RNA helicase DDX24 [Eumeta japonica]